MRRAGHVNIEVVPEQSKLRARRLRRLARWMGWAAVLIVAAPAALVYWFAWRPLPRTSGTVEAPVGREVVIARDELGVPHISAASLDDALFAQGYATAQERLWQMDALRRLAAGELAEVVGPAGIESDREARRLRLRRLAVECRRATPAAERAVLDAYARGVNFFIETHAGRLPLEFTLLGYRPRPWRAEDSLLVGLHMIRALSTTWKTDLARYHLLASGDPARVRVLFPARGGGEAQPGSNAWALAGRHTASGRPLLANDMHLEWSLPCAWFMVRLRAPGLHVAGVALPGLPGVIAGHNERIAWGITNLEFDLQDLYLEDIDLGTGRCRFQGNTEQARAEREAIAVRGSRPIEFTNWVTRHGPLWVTEGGAPMSLRWVGAEASRFRFPFLDINRARDWREFRSALAPLAAPAANFVYADVDGNIGHQVAGLLPARRGFTGEAPLDGSSGAHEWPGFIPFDELPSVLNPPSGVIVSANDNPFPGNYPYAVGGNFAAPYRPRQIRDLLAARGRWRAEDMLAVQKDVYSPFAMFLARQLTAAYERRRANNPRLEETLTLLREWNGQMEKDSAAALVVTFAFQRLRQALAERAAPGRGAFYADRVSTAAIERLLRARPEGWFRDWDAALVRALSEGVEYGRRLRGEDPARWEYGEYLRLRIAHPITHRLPVVGGWFDIGPAPMSGSLTTVKQTSMRLGPSMRMSVDLGDWERSLLNVAIGQSGHALSQHYRDQWGPYYAGRGLPMRFERVDAGETLRLAPRQH